MNSVCHSLFRNLEPKLSQETLEVLEAQGFVNATPVQAATIPLLCGYKDVAVDAATGSGKTLAFLVPLVEILRRLTKPLGVHEVGAVIISPTRELASQIFHVAEPFTATLPNLRATLLVGGTDVAADVTRLRQDGANLLIGTPGRLHDIIERASSLDFRHLEVLVLDEADRLLDMGFQRQISSIIGVLPKQRRTGLFSATQTREVQELAKAGLRNPVRVEVKIEAKRLQSSDAIEKPSKTPARLSIQYMICEADEKPSQLVHFLSQHSTSKVILYFMTCNCVDYWGVALRQSKLLKGIPSVFLHGKMKQSVRERALATFTSLPSGILCCTDVAARGLDIPGVDWIVQYDPPQDPNVFVHRVGRTARMGRSGNAVCFLLPKEDSYVEFLRLRSIPIEEKQKYSDVVDIIPQLRAAAKSDREIMEKGLKAFVSYIRAYKEHQCNFIFRWKELDLGKVGMGYGLLQLPSMPELKRGVLSGANFVPVKIDLAKIPYKDKVREKQRLKNAVIKGAAKAAEAKQNAKRKGRHKAEEMNKEKKPTKRMRDSRKAEEEDEMDKDYRLLKKLKKGAISEEEFGKAVGVDEFDPNARTGPKVHGNREKCFSKRKY